jgi:hypothetical protein
MQWESYAPREFEGVLYGMKGLSFRDYIEIPAHAPGDFELVIGGGSTPVDLLTHHGWRLHDPREITRDPWTYESFIRRSKAEFSVAKHGYVVSSNGWFSERSTAYLASGRPVVLQDTGFSRHFPVGDGLLAFNDFDGALAALNDIEGRYGAHCRAARRIAEDHFDARIVLPPLLESAMRQAATPERCHRD